MARYIRFILNIPKTVTAVMVLITLFFAYGATKLEFDNSVESFLPQDDKEFLFYNQTKEIFGDSGRFLIVLISPDKPLDSLTFHLMNDLVLDLEEYQYFDETREKQRLEKVRELAATKTISGVRLIKAFNGDDSFLRAIQRHLGIALTPDTTLHRRDLDYLLTALEKDYGLKAQELVDMIFSPVTAKDVSGEDDTLTTYDFIAKDRHGKRILPVSASDFEIYRKRLFRNPAFENVLYVTDKATGRITDFGMLITFDKIDDQDIIARHLCHIISSHSELKTVIQGMPYANIVFNDYMQRDLRRFLPIVLLVVVVVLFLNFRSGRGVALPVVTLSMATVWVIGLMGYLGIRMTAVGVSLPPLMAAVGSSYSIHILNQYYIDLEMISRKGLREGVVRSMSHISFTVFLAGLTTFVAFMTLCTNQVSAIREWGIFSAIGVVISVFIACTLIPAWISILPHKLQKCMAKKSKTARSTKKTVIDRVVTIMIVGAVDHYKAVLTAVLVVIAVSSAGLLRLNVESDFLQYFKKDDPIRTSADLIEDKLGGRWGFTILIDSGKKDGVKTPAFLNTVESVRKWLTADENHRLNIGRTDAFTDFVKTMHMAMNNDDPSYYTVPKRPEDIMDYLEIYSGEDENADARVDEFESYVDPDFRTVSILARFKRKENYTLGSAQIKRILDEVDIHLTQTLPKNYRHHITGFPVMNVKMADYIISGQLQSLFLSFVIIALIVLVLFRNIKAAFLSLIPMSVAVIMSFGIMGWFHINLDTVTSIIAAITIGIGIDDTIHVLNTYRHFGTQGLTIEKTLERVLRVTGKAVIYTSLVLIAGFSILTISNFKPVILFGILMAITMIATTIGALLVLPAVLRMTRMDVSPLRSGFWTFFKSGNKRYN